MRWILGILLAAIIVSGAYAQEAFSVPVAATAPTCAGDLTGTFPNCTVAKINGSTPAAIATSGSAADLTGSTKRTVTTVAGLPACAAGTKGQLMMVTDALTPVALATAVAGGAVSIGVTCNGTAWIIQ